MKLKRAVYFARKEEGKMARIMTEIMGWLMVRRLESREAGDGYPAVHRAARCTARRKRASAAPAQETSGD